MKIIYEAFDGTHFDNESECTDYEWKKQHEAAFKELFFYDKSGNILNDKLSEETYGNTMHIEVRSQEALQALHDLADYTGFCCYESVTDIGHWYWTGDDNYNGHFEKR